MAGYFFCKERILKPGPLRGIYFVLFALFFILTEIGRAKYRPYIYRNGINDYGLADVIGNLLGTIAIIFFLLGVNHATRNQGMRIIPFATGGIVVYELLQPVLPRGVLDWKDIVSTIAAGFIALLILLPIWRFVHDPLSDE